MIDAEDLTHLRQHGWLRIRNAVPKKLCDKLVDVLAREIGVPVNDPSRWDAYGGHMADFVPVWGHQAQWDIRQHPGLHRIFTALCGTAALSVTLDSCRFTPPWRPGHAEPYGIHWDRPPLGGDHLLQAALALTDTAADQGGFRCVPSLFQEPRAWPAKPTIDAAGEEDWLAETGGREIVHVPAQAGDLIAWHSSLPHGNSTNRSGRPRLAFYVTMFPAKDETPRRAHVESWRTGRCVPWWRGRRGYDRTEPWPPAELTPLGRKLLGLDSW